MELNITPPEQESLGSAPTTSNPSENAAIPARPSAASPIETVSVPQANGVHFSVPSESVASSVFTDPSTVIAPTVMKPTGPGATTDDVVNSQASLVATSTSIPFSGNSGGKRKRWLLAVVSLAVGVLLVGGYVFGMYLPNRPSAIYSSSLKNSGKAVDMLVAYGNAQAKKNYKSYDFDSTLNVKSSSASYDATLKGAFDKNANGTLKLAADILGEKVGANVRSIHAKGNSSPDVYVQVSGIKSALDKYGLNKLDNLDGQWISIDHTLLDTYSANLQKSAGTTSASAFTVPSSEDINDLLVKVQGVNKHYLFTTDTSTAVLKSQKYIAHETKDGRPVDHYSVGYDKAHLQAYTAALKTAADSSKLNDWAKKTNNGKNLSTVLHFDTLSSSIQTAKADYTFELWADTKTKLIHSVQFADPSDKNSIITLTQNYSSGSQYPFSFTFAGTDSSTHKLQNGKLAVVLDTSTNKSVATMSGNASGMDVAFKLTLTPTDNVVQVETPTGAQSVNTLLGKLGLGSTPTTPTVIVNDNNLLKPIH